MISLDNLRKRSGLLITGIGFALLAFLLGDLMSSGTTLLNGSQGKLGEINNEVVDYREFETEAQNIDRIFSGLQDRSGLRDNLWLDKVNEVVMGEQYNELGLSVCPEELAGLTFGYKSAEMSATAKQFFEVEIGAPKVISLIFPVGSKSSSLEYKSDNISSDLMASNPSDEILPFDIVSKS